MAYQLLMGYLILKFETFLSVWLGLFVWWHMSLTDKAFGWKGHLSEIIWRFQVQSQQQVRLTSYTYYNLTLVTGHG